MYIDTHLLHLRERLRSDMRGLLGRGCVSEATFEKSKAVCMYAYMYVCMYGLFDMHGLFGRGCVLEATFEKSKAVCMYAYMCVCMYGVYAICMSCWGETACGKHFLSEQCRLNVCMHICMYVWSLCDMHDLFGRDSV